VNVGIGKFLRDGLTQAGIESAFRRTVAAITAGFQIEHKENGTHRDITANSLTVTADTATGAEGGITADGDGVFGGDVVALDGTGGECGIGILATVNGATFQAGEPIRHGLLLAGTTGFWVESRPAASPFNGGTNELRVWHLSHDAATPTLRLGLISSVPTLMDGGTGSAAISLGSATRPAATVYTAAAITDGLHLTDGVSAPSTTLGLAKIYVDTADGDLKVKFGDGTVKTLATDT